MGCSQRAPIDFNLGPEAEALKEVSRLLELEPDFRISEWVKPGAGQRHMHNKLVIEGIRKAGIPE